MVRMWDLQEGSWVVGTYTCRPVGLSASPMHPWLQEGSILARLPANHRELDCCGPRNGGAYSLWELSSLDVNLSQVFSQQWKANDAAYSFGSIFTDLRTFI